MSVSLRYVDAPEGVQETLAVEAEGGGIFSLPADVAAGVKDVPWATLEPEVWTLDGSRKLLEATSRPGWWSEEPSGEDGLFVRIPVLTLRLPEPCTATGLTFTFSPSTGQWCSRIRLYWYNGQTLLHGGEYTPDSPRWTISRTVEGFDKVCIHLLQTNLPHQLAKVQQVEIGQNIRFAGDEIESIQLINEADPSLCSLSADTMTVNILDRQARNLIPQENQRLELYQNDTLRAVQYIVSGTREGKNRYRFQCQSMIGLLEDTFLGGLYRDKELEVLVGEILGSIPFSLADCYRGMTVTGYLPVCTQREALQRIAFAIGAVITTQDSDRLCMKPLSGAVRSAVSPAEIFLGAKMTTQPRMARVEITAHSYTPTQEEVTLLQDEQVDGTDVRFVFHEPHHSYNLTGGTLAAWGDNWVEIDAQGPVTLTAKTYLHTKTRHTRVNPRATAREGGNYLAVEDDELIHSGNVKDALNRLYDYCLLRQILEQDMVVRTQRAGDRVSCAAPWGGRITGYFSSMDCTITQVGTVARVKIPGMEAVPEAILAYSGELYAGDKGVPAGC